MLGDLDYEIAAFTHGPHIADGARGAVRGFLSAPRSSVQGSEVER